MKYEAMNVEIIRLENEDILTLSIGAGADENNAGQGMSMGFDDLVFR